MSLTRRHSPAFTMFELLVCIAFLAFTLGGIIAVFMAGSRFGREAQEMSEAARVAQAVFDFADTVKASPAWGRNSAGLVVDGTIEDHTHWSEAADPAYDQVASEFDLLWEAAITPTDPLEFDGMGGLHYLIVTVHKDEDQTLTITPDDREIGKFYSILADR